MGKFITIPSIDKVLITKTEKAFSLMDHLCEAKRLLRYNKTCYIGQLVGEALKETDDAIDLLNKAIKERLNTWKGLLHKYYKMTLYKKAEYGEYIHIFYVYPYNIIQENETLWMLEVCPTDDYNGGVHDKSYTLDSNFDYNITLEEVTPEEFNKEAIKSTLHVINRRLNREKEKLQKDGKDY